MIERDPLGGSVELALAAFQQVFVVPASPDLLAAAIRRCHAARDEGGEVSQLRGRSIRGFAGPGQQRGDLDGTIPAP